MYSKDDIAELPLSARLHFIHRVLSEELRMRRVARIANQRQKIAEIETCIQYIKAIDEELFRAKGIVIEHKSMTEEMEAAIQRHRLPAGTRRDKVIIEALDKAKGPA